MLSEAHFAKAVGFSYLQKDVEYNDSSECSKRNTNWSEGGSSLAASWHCDVVGGHSEDDHVEKERDLQDSETPLFVDDTHNESRHNGGYHQQVYTIVSDSSKDVSE